MKTKINVTVEMPDKVQEDYKYRNLYDKVCDYMLVCESDEDSEYHWRYLKTLYNKLHERKSLPETYMAIMEALEDFMSKYAQQDSGDHQANLTGENMFKYRGDA